MVLQHLQSFSFNLSVLVMAALFGAVTLPPIVAVINRGYRAASNGQMVLKSPPLLWSLMLVFVAQALSFAATLLCDPPHPRVPVNAQVIVISAMLEYIIVFTVLIHLMTRQGAVRWIPVAFVHFLFQSIFVVGVVLLVASYFQTLT